MTALVSFYDGMQLSQACEVLDAAGIPPAVQEIAGDATTGTPSRFEVWVDAGAVEHGKAALRGSLGLFPADESVEAADAEFPDDGMDGIVGQFATRAEAEQAQLILVDAGFEAHVDGEASGDETAAFLLKVLPAEYSRAILLLAARLGAE